MPSFLRENLPKQNAVYITLDLVYSSLFERIREKNAPLINVMDISCKLLGTFTSAISVISILSESGGKCAFYNKSNIVAIGFYGIKVCPY